MPNPFHLRVSWRFLSFAFVLAFSAGAIAARRLPSQAQTSGPTPLPSSDSAGASITSLLPGASIAMVNPVEAHTETSYRAAYFYSVASLLGLRGDLKDQAVLLERACEADPTSEFLLTECAETAVNLGFKARAAELFKRALDRKPGDLDLRRRLAALYQDSGSPDQARGLFLKPGGGDPTDPEKLRSLIKLDVAQQDFVSAERRLRVLLKKSGSSSDRELLALTLQNLQHWREAASAYRRVLAEDAGRVPLWESLAACDEAAGDTSAAKADLKAACKANANSPLLADQLGRLQYATQDYAGAAAAFDRLVSLDPGDPHGLLYRGLSRLKSGRYGEAESDFRALGAIDKDDTEQHFVLALALLLQKKYALAGEQLEHLLKLDPKSEEAWAELAFVEGREKGLTQTALILGQGLKEVPNSGELTLLLAENQEDLKDLSGAEATLRAALRHGGGDEVLFQLAVLLDKDGRFPDAEKELNTLITESPKHAEALNYLGYSWADRGSNLVPAEALIRRALAVDPDNRFYRDSLGWVLFKQGRFKDAVKPLAQAAKGLARSDIADEAVVFEHLAAVQKKLGHLKGTRASLKIAAEIRQRARKRPVTDFDPATSLESGL